MWFCLTNQTRSKLQILTVLRCDSVQQTIVEFPCNLDPSQHWLYIIFRQDAATKNVPKKDTKRRKAPMKKQQTWDLLLAVNLFEGSDSPLVFLGKRWWELPKTLCHQQKRQSQKKQTQLKKPRSVSQSQKNRSMSNVNTQSRDLTVPN